MEVVAMMQYMLHYLAVKVGDVTTATQMVWVVVELHLLVCVAFLEVVLHCPCHNTCLRSLQAADIAAEALAIDIAVVVLTIVRHCKGNANREQYKMNSFIFIAEMQLTLSKGCIIILDNLQLPGIFNLIINRQAISFTTCILDAAWVRTVRGEVTNYILDIGKLDFLPVSVPYVLVCAICPPALPLCGTDAPFTTLSTLLTAS